MGCSHTEEERLRYVAGLMGEEEEIHFERHMFRCPECRRAVEMLAVEERLLKAVMREVGRRGDVVSSVMRRIVVRKIRVWRWVVAGVSAAALLIAAVIPWSKSTKIYVAAHSVTHTLTIPPPKPSPPNKAIIDTNLAKTAEEEGLD